MFVSYSRFNKIRSTISKCSYRSIHHNTFINLNVSTVTPTIIPNKAKHMIFLHGLFGSGSNWRAIASSVTNEVSINSHLVDLRNHGLSPHTEEMSYTSMANDIYHLIKNKNMDEVILLGHSMGGKVAMQVALKHPDIIKKLIVVDVAPVKYNHYSFHKNLMEYMQKMELDKINSRKEADKIMSEFIQDEITRGFILQNLVGDPDKSGKYKWRLNLEVLHRTFYDWIDADTYNGKYDGDTLFIGGSDSNYIKEEYKPRIKELFPSSQIEMIEHGNHYVHFQKRDKFLEILTSFLKLSG